MSPGKAKHGFARELSADYGCQTLASLSHFIKIDPESQPRIKTFLSTFPPGTPTVRSDKPVRRHRRRPSGGSAVRKEAATGAVPKPSHRRGGPAGGRGPKPKPPGRTGDRFTFANPPGPTKAGHLASVVYIVIKLKCQTFFACILTLFFWLKPVKTQTKFLERNGQTFPGAIRIECQYKKHISMGYHEYVYTKYIKSLN
jgi:hypothetical protein